MNKISLKEAHFNKTASDAIDTSYNYDGWLVKTSEELMENIDAFRDKVFNTAAHFENDVNPDLVGSEHIWVLEVPNTPEKIKEFIVTITAIGLVYEELAEHYAREKNEYGYAGRLGNGTYDPWNPERWIRGIDPHNPNRVGFDFTYPDGEAECDEDDDFVNNRDASYRWAYTYNVYNPAETIPTITALQKEFLLKYGNGYCRFYAWYKKRIGAGAMTLLTSYRINKNLPVAFWFGSAKKWLKEHPDWIVKNKGQYYIA